VVRGTCNSSKDQLHVGSVHFPPDKMVKVLVDVAVQMLAHVVCVVQQVTHYTLRGAVSRISQIGHMPVEVPLRCIDERSRHEMSAELHGPENGYPAD